MKDPMEERIDSYRVFGSDNNNRSGLGRRVFLMGEMDGSTIALILRNIQIEFDSSFLCFGTSWSFDIQLYFRHNALFLFLRSSISSPTGST